jgi:hypothetical protein
VALLALLTTAVVAVQCPFGYPPEQACPESSPKCALYTDADSDGYCDNPGPRTPPADTPPDTVPEVGIVLPADTVQQEIQPDTTGPDPVRDPVDTIAETAPDTLLASPSDTASPAPADTLPEFSGCPLGYTESQACSASSPSCALFSDPDSDSLCDNPAPGPDTTAAARDSFPAVTSTSNGCPRDLPPVAACPGDFQLCPHWFDRLPSGACLNPERGRIRAWAVLLVTAVLLAAATFLSRTMRGGPKVRRRARTTRLMVLITSLIVLGFVVQGCFCPLGVFQYLFGGREALAFLGIAGLLVLLLPVVHALFFGRVYCGWVCPMGALQELAHRLDILHAPHPPGHLGRTLLVLRAVVFAAFIALLALAWSGAVEAAWPALFCSVDPFHSVFSLFMAGSLAAGIGILVVSLLWGRFFCRYLCFYGFMLGIACRLGLWSHLRRLCGRGRGSCALPPDSGEYSGSCGTGTD